VQAKDMTISAWGSIIHRAAAKIRSWPDYPYLFLVLISPGFITELAAQNYNLSFKHISIEQGLSQSSVEDIYQDEKGFLWFGTQDGLNRYDGYTFKIFKHVQKDSLSLSDNWINIVTGDSAGNLWIGTLGGGLNRFNRFTEKFECFRYNPNDENTISSDYVSALLVDSTVYLWIGTDGGGLDLLNIKTGQFNKFWKDKSDPFSLGTDKITVLYKDKSGVIWIGTQGGGLCSAQKLKSGEYRFRRYISDPRQANSLSSNDILSILEDPQCNLWIGTQNGLNQLDKQRKKFKSYLVRKNDLNSLNNHMIHSVFCDRTGLIWLATDLGLNVLDPLSDKFWHVLSDPAKSNGLSGDLLRCIYADRSGTIWIGTYGAGLNHFDWKKKRFGHFKNEPGDPNSLTDNTVWSILVDRRENLWLGTSKGVNRFDKRTNKLTAFRAESRKKNALSDDFIRVLGEDQNGMIWFGTNAGGLCEYDPARNSITVYKYNPKDLSGISSNNIRAMLQDHQGNMWVGTWAGLDQFITDRKSFRHYRNDPFNKNSITDNRILCLFEDKKGFIWIGTYKGLNKFNQVSKTFTRYMTEPDNPNSLSHERVSAILQDRKGIIWIGTLGGGLNRFDPNENVFTHFTESEGLPHSTIYGLVQDDDGYLWISTNRGLSRFDPDSLTFKNFDANDGLQSNEFNAGACFKSKSGELFFGGINGYNRFYPKAVKEHMFVPPLIVTSFKIFDKEVNLDTTISEIHKLQLSYLKNFFAFEFAALDYSNPEKNIYAYKLEGFDREWIQCGNRRYANYTNLDGGEYDFKVTGTNSDGLWNKTGTSIKIIIAPPFWKTWWFRILATFFILGLVYVVYKLSMRRVDQQRQFLESQVAERTQELKERNRLLSRSKRETDNIMRNVEEGIFLIDPELKLRSQYSLAVEKILEEKRVARKNFLEMVERKLTKKIFTNLQEFLELMFKTEVDEDTLKDLNPLSEIEFNFRDETEVWLKSKYLSFKFKRVIDDEDKVSELIVTVNDLSDQIVLARKLEESLAMSKKQMDWLLSILHVEPKLLQEFSESAYLELDYIDKVLRQDEQATNYIPVLEKVYRSMHILKGNASLLDLKFFVEKAHEFEDRIEDLKKKPKLRGSDFVPLVMRLGDIRRTLDELHNLIERVSNVHSHFRPKRSYESELFIKSIENLINNLAQEQGKKVKLVYDKFDAGNIPYHYRLTTREIMIQMVRNAIYHGIENPEERSELKKDSQAKIEIEMILNEKIFGFTFRDDGRGLQLDKLRDKARASGHWPAKEIDNWTNQQIAEVIYKSGISTSEKADLIAGRGVGMDLVKDKIDRLGGDIKINTKTGKFCEFTIKIPLTKKTQEAALKEKAFAAAES
jgi:ligand-binding sensor domain-containing protein/HPt (histidine-containing phosphotransfer) domain-containing protein